MGDVDDRLGLGLIDGPTPVQLMAIPEILMACKERMAFVEDRGDKLEGYPSCHSIAFAASTGSGKTLAYLLPIVQSLRAQELMSLGDLTGERRMEALSRLRRLRRPCALVLALTRELARQILSVLKSVGHVCKVSSDILVGGDDYGAQRKRLADRPVDGGSSVLVCTDIASRGLDVPHVDHVVMFDFPLNSIDYQKHK